MSLLEADFMPRFARKRAGRFLATNQLASGLSEQARFLILTFNILKNAQIKPQPHENRN